MKQMPFTSEELRVVFNTNLIEYATAQGFDVVKADRKSYRIKGYGGLFLFPRGFHHFSNMESGNIIDFAKIYQGLSFVEAVESILGTRAYANTIPIQTEEKRQNIRLPPKAPNNDKARNYLVKDRYLDPTIVDELINQGKIYQATTTNKGISFDNCAFVSYDQNNVPKYCALRGLNKSRFRQDIAHSDKSYGFNMVGTGHRVFVFESPIDAISHATLCKLNNIDYMADSRISEGGLFDKALTRFLKDNEHIKEIVFCFDNDIDGVDHQNNPRNHGQLFAKKCIDKFATLGYVTYMGTPTRKDFNTDLEFIQKSVIQELKNRKLQVQPPNKGEKKQDGYEH